MLWETEMSVHDGARGVRNPAAFAKHAQHKFLDRSLLIKGHDARQVQVLVDASLPDVEGFAYKWVFLRYKSTLGPGHVLVSEGAGVRPSEDEILQGLRPPSRA